MRMPVSLDVHDVVPGRSVIFREDTVWDWGIRNPDRYGGGGKAHPNIVPVADAAASLQIHGTLRAIRSYADITLLFSTQKDDVFVPMYQHAMVPHEYSLVPAMWLALPSLFGDEYPPTGSGFIMKEAPLPASDPTSNCIKHGPAIPLTDHPDCPVVMDSPRLGGPTVCTCECRTCKRAWFTAGRPSTKELRVQKASK